MPHIRPIPQSLMKRALEVADLICQASPDGVRATKALAKYGLEHGWMETNIATNTVAEVQAMYRSVNMKEGTEAFTNKRKPKWGGYAKI